MTILHRGNCPFWNIAFQAQGLNVRRWLDLRSGALQGALLEETYE